MPANFILNAGANRVLEKSVRSVYVAAGQAVVVVNADDNALENAHVLDAEEGFDTEGAANVTLYSTEGASVNVVYADDPDGAQPVAAKSAKAGDASAPPAGESKAKEAQAEEKPKAKPKAKATKKAKSKK